MSPRENLRPLAAACGESLADLPALIGRSATYSDQFVTRGLPGRLPSDGCLHLVSCRTVEERTLDARDPWEPAH